MADTKSVASLGNETSDIFTMQTDTVAASIQCMVTGITDDVVEFRILPSLGNVDGITTDDYATVIQANIVDRINTASASPGVSTNVPFSACETLKIYAENFGDAAAVVSAFILEIAPDGSQTKTRISWPA